MKLSRHHLKIEGNKFSGGEMLRGGVENDDVKWVVGLSFFVKTSVQGKTLTVGYGKPEW